MIWTRKQWTDLGERLILALKDFDESKHPRDSHGRFGEGSGSSGETSPHASPVSAAMAHAAEAMQKLPSDLRAHAESLGQTLAGHQDTQTQFDKVEGAAGKYSADRVAQQQGVIDHFMAAAKDIPNDKQGLMMGGLGGSGKTTTLNGEQGKQFIGDTKYMSINPDDVKSEMIRQGMGVKVPGLQPMEASPLLHEESSDIAKNLATQAMAQGKNMAWDITMASKGGVESRLNEMEQNGYKTKGVFVDIPVNQSIDRAMGRYQRGYESYQQGKGDGGRFVPPSIIAKSADPSGTYNSANRAVFEGQKSRYSDWAVFDNSGSAPRLVDQKH